MALTRTWRAWSAAGGRRSKPAPSRGNQPLKPAKSSLRCLERHRRRYREFLVQLIDVLQASMVDAVTLAGFGTDDFEQRALLVLGELLGGEPFPEQDPGFGFGVEAVSRLRANGDTRVAFARLHLSGAADNLATANQSV